MCSCEMGSAERLPAFEQSKGCSVWTASSAAGVFFARDRLSAGFAPDSGLLVLRPVTEAASGFFVALFLDATFDETAFFSLSDFFSFGIRKYGLEFAQIGVNGVAGTGDFSQDNAPRLVTVEGAGRFCISEQAGATVRKNQSPRFVRLE